MIGLNPNRTFDVTIDADVEQSRASGAQPTVFIARGWTVEREARVRESLVRANAAVTETERGETTYDSIVEILRQSIVGWRHFNDADGDPIKIALKSDGTLSEESLAAIPFWARPELAGKIMEANGITRATVGKSAPSPEGAGPK